MSDFMCRIELFNRYDGGSNTHNSRFVCIKTFTIGNITIRKGTVWSVYTLVCDDNNFNNKIFLSSKSYLYKYLTDFSVLEKYFRQIEPESSRPNLRLYKDFVFDYKKDLVFIVALFILLIASWFGLCYLFDVLSQGKL